MDAAPKIAVVTGPTAAGKTALGVMLARQLGGEIVSADAMQVYRRMDIGTAKAAKDEMRGVPHHMIDVAEPWETYSVARYVAQADACVRDILERGLIPIIVGGTGLYIDSLVAGRSFDGGSADDALRAALERKYCALGGEKLLEALAAVDPERAARLHPADKKRIIRALEVWHATGRTITEHDLETQKKAKRYDALVIALSFEARADLYDRIDRRAEAMEKAGLFDEVQALLDSGVSEKCTAMQAIGYKEAARALRGEISRREAVGLIQRESRRYAKRQLTWLRGKPGLCWVLWQGSPDFNRGRQISTEFLLSGGLK
ncbi:MAG: tRNA (adenosine(37)-N6)-dimethylallyltransferase MiaA [Oscillospiraceae bacterium]|jgi:tRNA dimethylallyltransferase|nr:tRNA (adenosine(37)-N6)-dimethylallyltransferase MiaA [Oscillospiraceae bacterium]